VADDLVMRGVRVAFAAGAFTVMLFTHMLGLHRHDCRAERA
jgi:hypothetical protein